MCIYGIPVFCYRYGMPKEVCLRALFFKRGDSMEKQPISWSPNPPKDNTTLTQWIWKMMEVSG